MWLSGPVIASIFLWCNPLAASNIYTFLCWLGFVIAAPLTNVFAYKCFSVDIKLMRIEKRQIWTWYFSRNYYKKIIQFNFPCYFANYICFHWRPKLDELSKLIYSFMWFIYYVRWHSRIAMMCKLFQVVVAFEKFCITSRTSVTLSTSKMFSDGYVQSCVNNEKRKMKKKIREKHLTTT